ncbi:MAG TPA: biopolymer transporter ExbD [Bacteroidia bacterium]|nr:biopolymer transporter ExbD [Bacteroidia bacterium]
MAQIMEGGGGGHGKGKKRAKKHSVNVDMTPMVDLGFLLLTFFVLTTQFSKPKTMEINMPVKPKDTTNNMKVQDKTALTLLLTDRKDKIYYYFGVFKPETSIIKTTDFSRIGIRKILRDRNQDVINQIKELKAKLISNQIADTTYKRLAVGIKGDKKAMFVIVKMDDKAKYKGMVDILDELTLADVGKYALVDISPAEKEILKFFK